MGITLGLARVSTNNRGQDTSIEAQTRALLDAGCDRVIAVRESAFQGPRQGWHELRSMVASGRVSEVLCIDQSRLARDGSDMEFLEECAAKNVTVRALTGGIIETASVGGFLQAGVFSVVNQVYSRQLSLKTKDGIQRQRDQGRYARGTLPFGYTYDKAAGLVIPHSENWPIARQMFVDLLACEMNASHFIRTTQCTWTCQGVHGWAKNPILRGIVKYQKEGVRPIISSEEWATAKHLLDLRKKSRYSPTRTVHLLTGLVKCEQCEKNLSYQIRKDRPGQAVRLVCVYPRCDWYGRGIREQLVRQQSIDALRLQALAIQQGVQQSTVTMETTTSTERNAVLNKIEALEQLQATGVPGLEISLGLLRDELIELDGPIDGPNWAGLAELLAVPGVLERFTDAELRPLLIDYITQIFYVGNPREVKVRVRNSTG